MKLPYWTPIEYHRDIKSQEMLDIINETLRDWNSVFVLDFVLVYADTFSESTDKHRLSNNTPHALTHALFLLLLKGAVCRIL